jgi:hypothetical protein
VEPGGREHASLLQVLLKLTLTYEKEEPGDGKGVRRDMGGSWAR